MSKKKKIIIGIVCAVLVITGIVTGIILATIKRFDISTINGASYRDYNKMTEITLDGNYYIDGNFFLDGGLAKIKNTSLSDNNEGYYNFATGEMVIPAEYNVADTTPTSEDNLLPITITSIDNIETGTIYKVTKQDNEITFLNKFGENTDITEYDEENKITYGQIKEKVISTSNKKSLVKAKVKNSFTTKKIEITSATFDRCYYSKGLYNYEVWNLADNEGNIHTNIYSVKNNGKRNLVQTISNNIGANANIDFTSTISFLKDGGIRFVIMTPSRISDNAKTITINYQIFDVNFKEENSFNITINQDNYVSTFIVGNAMFIQEKIPSSEKKYNFVEVDNDGTARYYQLLTHKINFKSGKKSKVNFDYLVTEYDSVNAETSYITARKIKSKILQNETTYLINERLQTKEIGYEINSLYRVSKTRYIVESDMGLILIDKRFNKIANLGNYSEYFTTNSSIILTDNTYSYVTTHDGIVVKRYNKDQIVNILDDQYYLVKLNVTRDDNNYTEHYLENLGKRLSTPIYTKQEGSSSYTYNNKSYNTYSYSVMNGSNSTDIAIITRVYQEAETFVYEFYNIHGDLLNKINNVQSSTKTLQLCYEDTDLIVVYLEDGIRGHYFTITR